MVVGSTKKKRLVRKKDAQNPLKSRDNEMMSQTLSLLASYVMSCVHWTSFSNRLHVLKICKTACIFLPSLPFFYDSLLFLLFKKLDSRMFSLILPSSFFKVCLFFFFRNAFLIRVLKFISTMTKYELVNLRCASCIWYALLNWPHMISHLNNNGYFCLF